jgi:hypothetical protein
LAEETDLIPDLWIGFHLAINDFRCVKGGGMASVDGVGNILERFISVLPAQIEIDVSGICMDFLS